MSVQNSRFCLNFTDHQAQAPVTPHHHPQLSPPETTITTTVTTPSQLLTFSVEYWQPFIDQRDFKTSSGGNSSTVCGPLLGILVELAKQMDARLAFIPDASDEILPFPEMENGSVQFVLTPFAPMSLEDDRVSRLVRFSEPLGDIPMISILSGREPLTMDFEAAKLFNYAFFYLYFLSFLLINASALVIVPWKVYRRLGFLPNSVRVLLKQPLRKKKTRRRKEGGKTPEKCFPALPHLLLLPNLFLLTGLFHLIFSTKLLAFFTFSLPYRKVDTLSELLAEKDMSITLFKGETSVEILLPEKEEDKRYSSFDKSRVSIANPSNDVAGEWERSVAGRIASRSEAIISDAYYLDYVFNSHVHRLPMLYRGAEDRLVLPYFLPLSVCNPPELNDALNRLITHLRESGIYEFWLREVKEANGHLKNMVRHRGRRRANSLDYDLLTLRDCRLLFYLLSGLLSLAGALFALEEVLGRREKRGKSTTLPVQRP